MKNNPRLLLLLFLFASTTSFAGITVTTKSGKVYENAEVKSVTGTTVSISHSGGVASVPLLELSKPVRKSLNLKMTEAVAKGDLMSRISGNKEIFTKFDVTYEGHLKNLAKEAQSQGRLDDVLAIKKEMEVFRSGAKAEAGNFAKLKQLRVIYDRERAKRRNKIIDNVEAALKQYQLDLREVQKDLTIANKLEEAIAVKEREEEVAKMVATPGAALKIFGIESGDGSTVAVNTAPSSTAGIDAHPVTKEHPFENSLGMRFVPVPITGGGSDGKNILFSIWETRIKDYKTFIKKARLPDLPALTYPVDKNHPVSVISWDEAEAFCKWLTDKERKKGLIGVSDEYRLPTDHEWSCAVGIGDQEDASQSPSLKSGKIEGIYPWGEDFPPPKGAGNYYGQETLKNPFRINGDPIEGYEDAFDRSSPVGSFDPNPFGIYDLGGNAWEWCDDWYDTNKKEWRVIRGACWAPGGEFGLRSSFRYAPKTAKAEYTGFRVLLERGGGKGNAVAVPSGPIGDASKDKPFENGLGMRFVPVPIKGGPTDGQNVLFNIWETRIIDYKEFTKSESGHELPDIGFGQDEDHPVANASWDSADSFCKWLTEREHKNGKLPGNLVYRLPSDHEWSCAVGIGELEDANASPQAKSGKTGNHFPWGESYPPKTGAGNYYGEEANDNPVQEKQVRKVIPGYKDAFTRTARVGSFDANTYGLFDIGGNIWEWCSDFFDPDKKERRVLRGHSWNGGDSEFALGSSFRGHAPPASIYHNRGFRVVIGEPCAVN